MIPLGIDGSQLYETSCKCFHRTWIYLDASWLTPPSRTPEISQGHHSSEALVGATYYSLFWIAPYSDTYDSRCCCRFARISPCSSSVRVFAAFRCICFFLFRDNTSSIVIHQSILTLS